MRFRSVLDDQAAGFGVAAAVGGGSVASDRAGPIVGDDALVVGEPCTESDVGGPVEARFG